MDFWRNLKKTEAEKRQEALTGYLDNALTPGARQRFEQQMAMDDGLQSEMEQQRLVKQQLGQLPRVRAPRNFTLDPALYGRPQPQVSAHLYPLLRTATLVVAVFLVMVITADFFTSSLQRRATVAQQPETPVKVMEEAESEAANGAVAGDNGTFASQSTEEAEGEAAPAAEVMEEAAVEEEAPVEEAADMAETPLSAPTLSGGAADVYPPPAPAAGLFPTATITGTARAGLTETYGFTVTEPVARPTIPQATQTPAPPPPPTVGLTPEDVPPSLVSYRALEIGLGVTVVALLAITLWLRRRL